MTSTDLDQGTSEKAYARWAPVYDIVFGAAFERGPHPDDGRWTSLKSLLVSQLALFCQNDAANGPCAPAWQPH
jgi:hypothetical protein